MSIKNSRLFHFSIYLSAVAQVKEKIMLPTIMRIKNSVTASFKKLETFYQTKSLQLSVVQAAKDNKYQSTLDVQLKSAKEAFSRGLFKEMSFEEQALFKPLTQQDPKLTREEQSVAFTNALRRALKSSSYKNLGNVAFRQALQAICLARFENTVVMDYEDQLLAEISPLQPVDLSADKIAELILSKNKTLPKHASIIKKLKGEVGIDFDPNNNGNIPEVRSREVFKNSKGEEKTITYLRFGTPTIDPTPQGYALGEPPKIVPEFSAYLEASKSKNFLYINHQRNLLSTKIQAEQRRSEVIHNLENQHENFYFLSLPFDGPVIKEMDKGTDEEWMRKIIHSLVTGKDGFCMPAKMAKSFYALTDIASKIRKLYFNPSEKIDRRVFLMLFYHYIKEYVQAECDIDTKVSACKDNKDRGNTSATIDEALYNLRLNKDKERESLRDLYVRALASYSIKFEGVIVKNRLDFLADLLKHMTKLTDSQRSQIQQYHPVPNFKIAAQEIPREGYRLLS